MTGTMWLNPVLAAALFALAAGPAGAFAQSPEPPRPADSQSAFVGDGMGPLVPALLRVAPPTQFFLALADEISLTEDQRRRITELAYAFEIVVGRRRADLNVAEAEYHRLLTRDRVDMPQVRAKLAEIKAIEADVEFAGTEAVIGAIRVLSHEQHLAVLRRAAAEAPADPRPRIW